SQGRFACVRMDNGPFEPQMPDVAHGRWDREYEIVIPVRVGATASIFDCVVWSMRRAYADAVHPHAQAGAVRRFIGVPQWKGPLCKFVISAWKATKLEIISLAFEPGDLLRIDLEACGNEAEGHQGQAHKQDNPACPREKA